LNGDIICRRTIHDCRAFRRRNHGTWLGSWLCIVELLCILLIVLPFEYVLDTPFSRIYGYRLARKTVLVAPHK
jgi:hypothetical protein